jgi:hypothetical protein
MLKFIKVSFLETRIVFVKYNIKCCILVDTEEYDYKYRIKSNAPDIATTTEFAQRE